jgi:hypothetical protein
MTEAGDLQLRSQPPLLAESEVSLTQIDRLVGRLQANLKELVDIGSLTTLTAEEARDVKETIAQYWDVELSSLVREIFEDQTLSSL